MPFAPPPQGLRRYFVVAAVTACTSACGGDSAALQARVDRLEREVAALKGARAAGGEHAGPTAHPRCERVVNTAIPDRTTFPYVVDYEVGLDSIRSRDRIVITEVFGTRPGFEEGGIYRVHGTYALGSVDEATLALSITAAEVGDGCSAGNDRGARQIQRGSGTFELAAPIPYAGHPHVSFYVDGGNAGGVYFGKGAFLKR